MPARPIVPANPASVDQGKPSWEGIDCGRHADDGGRDHAVTMVDGTVAVNGLSGRERVTLPTGNTAGLRKTGGAPVFLSRLLWLPSIAPRPAAFAAGLFIPTRVEKISIV